MGACGVCMCGGGRGEGGRGQHCGKILSQKKRFEKIWYTSVANVSFDEIHCTVIT